MDSKVVEGQEAASAIKWTQIGLDEVRNDVPQGLVSEPLHFTISIDDINEEVFWEIFKFADDTKIAN